MANTASIAMPDPTEPRPTNVVRQVTDLIEFFARRVEGEPDLTDMQTILGRAV